MVIAIESSDESVEASNVTSHDCLIAPTVTASSILLQIFGKDGGGAPDHIDTGWTLRKDRSVGGTGLQVYDKDSVAGTEGGTTVNVDTTGDSQNSAHASLSLTGVTGSPQYSTGADGTGTGPQSDAITFGWGAKAGTLSLSIIECDDGDMTVTNPPSGYTLGAQSKSTGAAGVMVAWAWKVVSGATETPGAWLVSASEPWNAVTVGLEESVAALSFTTDKSNYDFSEGIVATLTGYSGTPTTATLNGHAITIQGGGSSSEITLTAPAESVFPFGQTYADTDWETNQVLQINDPSSGNSTANIQIVSVDTAGTEYTYVADGTPAGSVHPTEVVSGDRVRITRVSGTIANITAGGVVTWTGLAGDLDVMAFDVSAASWTDIDNIIGASNPTGTAVATFPSLSASAVGTFEKDVNGTAIATFPSLTGSASGTNEREFRLTAVATFPSFGGTAAGTNGNSAVGTAIATFPSMTGAAVGTVEEDVIPVTGAVIANFPSLNVFATDITYPSSGAPGITPGSKRRRMTSSQAA